ncbi:MAG: porin family protein [Candidatus Limimorpha sp.]
MKIKSEILKPLLTIISAIVLTTLPSNMSAQTKKPMNLRNYDNQPYHFGFVLGYNQMSYSFNYIDDYQNVPHTSSEYPEHNFSSDDTYYVRSMESKPNPGFTVGVVGNMRLGRYFDLRFIPSLNFGTRTITYQIFNEDRNLYLENNKSIFSTFVEFPLLVKYKSKRLNNVAAYLVCGANTKIDLASQKKWQTLDNNGQEVYKNIKVNRADVAAEVGVGFDFYTGYFKFGIEVKMGYGLLNILDKQNLLYDSSIENLHNRTFQVSLTFE